MRIFHRVRVLFSSLALALMLVLAGEQAPPARSQQAPPSRGYAGDLFGKDPVFLKASALRESYRYQESVAEFRRIADRHSGTELEATARWMAASDLRHHATLNPAAAGDSLQQQRLELQTLIQRFPNTKYWLEASLTLGGSLLSTEAILRQLGAPAFDDVGSGRVASIQEGSIPLQYRDIIADIFVMQGVGDNVPQARAIRFFSFVRLSFPTSGTLSAIHHLQELFPPSDQPIQPLNPQVKIKTPKEGQKKGPRPRFRARVQVGDYRYPQVDLGQIQFLVDGLNRRQELVIRSKIYPNVKPGQVFEKLKLTWRPTEALSQGPHTITLTVPTTGLALPDSSELARGRTQATVSFMVRGQRDDDEDERDDDTDDWDED